MSGSNPGTSSAGGPPSRGGPPSGGAPKAAPKASITKFKAALRKAIRKNAQEPAIDFLNITAMLDLMTIILVFVLQSLASSPQKLPSTDDLKLPTSVLEVPPSEEGVVVIISYTELTVNGKSVAMFPNHAELAVTGVDAKFKPQGGYLIKPFVDELRRFREDDKQIKQALHKDSSTSEAIIVADMRTPYRLLVEVLYSLGQAEFAKYHLMAMKGSAKDVQ